MTAQNFISVTALVARSSDSPCIQNGIIRERIMTQKYYYGKIITHAYLLKIKYKKCLYELWYKQRRDIQRRNDKISFHRKKMILVWVGTKSV